MDYFHAQTKLSYWCSRPHIILPMFISADLCLYWLFCKLSNERLSAIWSTLWVYNIVRFILYMSVIYSNFHFLQAFKYSWILETWHFWSNAGRKTKTTKRCRSISSTLEACSTIYVSYLVNISLLYMQRCIFFSYLSSFYYKRFFQSCADIFICWSFCTYDSFLLCPFIYHLWHYVFAYNKVPFTLDWWKAMIYICQCSIPHELYISFFCVLHFLQVSKMHVQLYDELSKKNAYNMHLKVNVLSWPNYFTLIYIWYLLCDVEWDYLLCQS